MIITKEDYSKLLKLPITTFEVECKEIHPSNKKEYLDKLKEIANENFGFVHKTFNIIYELFTKDEECLDSTKKQTKSKINIVKKLTYKLWNPSVNDSNNYSAHYQDSVTAKQKLKEHNININILKGVVATWYLKYGDIFNFMGYNNFNQNAKEKTFKDIEKYYLKLQENSLKTVCGYIERKLPECLIKLIENFYIIDKNNIDFKDLSIVGATKIYDNNYDIIEY